MNTLKLVATLGLLCVTSALAAPHDRIDPKALKDKVSLKLGSKGTIQFKQNGDAFTEPTLVKDPDAKQPGIGVNFDKKPEFLALTLENRLPKALRYRAAIRLKGRKDYFETSLIVPIPPGLVSYETWQDPIEELILFEFKFTDEKP